MILLTGTAFSGDDFKASVDRNEMLIDHGSAESASVFNEYYFSKRNPLYSAGPGLVESFTDRPFSSTSPASFTTFLEELGQPTLAPPEIPSALETENEMSPMSQIALVPKILDFGKVKTNQAKDLSFTITNNGKNTVAGQVAVSTPHQIIAGNFFTLAPGATQTVTVRFYPTATGLYLSNAVISSSTERVDISLRGEAVLATNEPMTVVK